MEEGNGKQYIETKRVIASVRAWPALWNPDDARYRNMGQRALAWTAVCQHVLEHYHHCSEQDKRVLEKRVQQRWRTARDSYVKAAGGAGGMGADAHYGFKDQLAFLEPTLRHPRAGQRPPRPPPAPRPPRRDHTQKTVDEKPRAKRSAKRAAAAAPSHCGPAAGLAMVEVEVEGEERGEGGGMSALERVLVEAARSPLAADDESFFRSLAPALAALTPHQKLVFRSRVLAVALDLQMEGDSVFVSVAPLSDASAAGESDGEEPPERKFRPPSPHAPAPADTSSGDSDQGHS